MSYHPLRRAAALAAVAALGACAPQAPAGLTDADHSAIEAVGNEFTQHMTSGNHAGVAALYTENGVILPPNGPAVTGRAAIEQFLASFPPVGQMHFGYVTVDGAGDVAFVHGTYHVVMQGPDGVTMEDSGKFIEIRRRQADGRWLISHDIWSSDVAMPMPEPMP